MERGEGVVVLMGTFAQKVGKIILRAKQVITCYGFVFLQVADAGWPIDVYIYMCARMCQCICV